VDQGNLRYQRLANLHNMELVYLLLTFSVSHTQFEVFAIVTQLAIVKQEARLYIFKYHTLGIHYDDLGSYKELLHFIEA
jgi:hypothetical protein